MIFIGGISNGIKQLFYNGRLRCPACKGMNEFDILMTYSCFTFFFIPLFKWNRRFFIRCRGCKAQYELSYEKGMEILHGIEDIELTPQDITPYNGSVEGAFGSGYAGGENYKAYSENYADNNAENSENADSEDIVSGKSYPGNVYPGNVYSHDVYSEDTDDANDRMLPLTEKRTDWKPAKKSQEDIRYCPHCGKPIQMDFIYCPYCGKEL